VLPTPQLQLAERRVVKRIRRQAVLVGDDADLVQPALGTLALRDGDGAVERDHRRGAQAHERVVERNDLGPVGLLQAAR